MIINGNNLNISYHETKNTTSTSSAPRLSSQMVLLRCGSGQTDKPVYLNDSLGVTFDRDTALINHSEIPKLDSMGLKIDLQFRRIKTGMHADSLDKQYYIDASMYYKTNQEKYRLSANKNYRLYHKWYSVYQKQQDSCDKNIIY